MTEPMSDERMEYFKSLRTNSTVLVWAHYYDELLSEIDRLRAEVERLEQTAEHNLPGCDR